MKAVTTFIKDFYFDKNHHMAWVKWLRMQGHRLPATLEVTGSRSGPGKINLIKIKKTSTGFLTLIKSGSLKGKKDARVSIKKHYYYS